MDLESTIGWVSTQTPPYILTIRLVLAAILGAAIGIEREFHATGAGLRTHILIATAAALFTMVSFEIYYLLDAYDENVKSDPLRAAEAVTAGVAFLGAGTIFRMGGNIRGLTTGAGMWLAGAIGFACASGLYGLALLATLLGLVSLYLLQKLNDTIADKT